MASRSNITILNDEASTTFDGIVRPDANAGRRTVRNLITWLHGIIGGVRSGVTVNLRSGATLSSGTVTFTDHPTNAQTCKIAGVTVTAATSGNGTTSFTLGADGSAAATNLAALINANTTISQILSASAASGVVTVTALVPGKVGDGVWFANVNLSNATFSAMSGGSDGTLTSFSLN